MEMVARMNNTFYFFSSPPFVLQLLIKQNDHSFVFYYGVDIVDLIRNMTPTIKDERKE